MTLPLFSPENDPGPTFAGLLSAVGRQPDNPELSREALAELLPEGPGQCPETISFPHGRYTPEAVKATREAGYKLACTSHELINEPRAGRYSWLLGRTNVSADNLSDATGRFRPDKLALWLFRGEHGFVDEHSHGLRDEQTRA